LLTADKVPALVPGDAAPGVELLARAFQAAPNGFLLVDRAGRILAANSELEAMFNVRPGTLIGERVEALIAESQRDAHRQLREQFAAQPTRRAMGGDRVLYARRPDGHEFPVEIGLNPLDGPPPMVLASVVDISERVALEQTFRGLFENSPFGLLIVDDRGQIALSNRALGEVLGYAPSALAGQPLDALLPERYRQRHGALMAGYRASGGARTMGQGRDLSALHRDGSEVPVEIGLSRVRWQGQTMTLVVVSDIGRRKRMELDLRQANANLEEFTYVASHDLRSPLRGIADLIEWIQADLGDQAPPSVVNNLGRVSVRIAKVERLIDDLLSYARAGRAATEYVRVDVAALVREILEIQPIPAGFTIAIDAAVAPFHATRVPLETVLRNLIANAIKHHDRPGGHVEVRARADDSFCEISIIDDGPGIPPAAQARVFKLFQTLTTSQRGGSGIGLALTKRVVEVHGGRIELGSPVADGRGAVFRIWWPRFPRRTHDEP
jgi:PAS domain S-box-containing protein